MTTTAIRNLWGAASAFIWTWLPGEKDPVPAGRLYRTESRHDFGYMSDYLQRENVIALGPDLPLRPGMRAIPGPSLSGTLSDALPNQWGRRATLALQLDRHGPSVDTREIDDIGYGLLGGTDGSARSPSRLPGRSSSGARRQTRRSSCSPRASL